MVKKHALGNLSGTADLLREHGFRATTGRIKLLKHLERSGKPLSVQDLLVMMRASVDQTTLYRTLSDLADAGIVKRVDLNTGIAHFEYTPDHPHHHHLICNDCGTIEDIEKCPAESLQRAVNSNSKGFKVYSHNLEFFGLCRTCSTK